MIIVKLLPKNKSKFHFGNYKGDIKKFFSSDGLFSAILNNLTKLYGKEEAEKFIQEFNAGSLILSSVFYGLDITKESKCIDSIYFLPKPSAEIRTDNSLENMTVHKEIKKIKFLSLNAYNDLLKTWDNSSYSFNYNLLNNLLIINREFAVKKEEAKNLDIGNANFININTRPRLKVHRKYNSSEDHFYHNELEISHIKTDNFMVKPFMYFLLKGNLSKKLKASFRLLADEGIGGKTSSGMGFFEDVRIIENTDFYNVTQNGKYFLNLSVYFPSEDEIENLLIYELDKRNGYLYSLATRSLRKKSLRVIKEGAIFKTTVSGKIEDVTPQQFTEHKVFLYGKPFLIGFGGEVDEINT